MNVLARTLYACKQRIAGERVQIGPQLVRRDLPARKHGYLDDALGRNPSGFILAHGLMADAEPAGDGAETD